MRLPQRWVGIDVIGSRLHENIIVHSVGGERVARRLGRAQTRLDCDTEGRRLLAGIVQAALDSGDYTDRCSVDNGIECRLHWIIAPDGVAVGLVVWLGEGPAPKSPVYNSWILDLQAVTTRSGGDNLALLGDGRRTGEEHPIRHLLQWMVVDDARQFVGLYYDALTASQAMLVEAHWSIDPHGNGQRTHFWSAANVTGDPAHRSEVYGLTVELRERNAAPHSTLDNLARAVTATLIMVDGRHRYVVTATGPLSCQFGERQYHQILDQIDIDAYLAATDGRTIERTITIDGESFSASAFLVDSAQQGKPSPIAIVLNAGSGRTN